MTDDNEGPKLTEVPDDEPAVIDYGPEDSEEYEPPKRQVAVVVEGVQQGYRDATDEDE